MHIRLTQHASAAALTLLLLALSGCNTTQTSVTTESVEPESKTEPATELSAIDQQLAAIGSLIELEQTDEARAILEGLLYAQLNIAQQTLYVLNQAKIAMAENDGLLALTWISGEYAHLLDGLPLEQQIDISLMRAEALELSGKPLAAARERIFLAPVLDEFQSEENQEQIWFNLHMVPVKQIREMVENESSPDLNGWLELALISVDQGYDINQLFASVKQWQQKHPRHPAASQLPNSLQMLRELAMTKPSHLAVMLPLSGQLEQAGNAIRNGLISAWYEAKADGLEVPELHFYNTVQYEDITELYSFATSAGAQLVIGPLAKSNVQQLADYERLTVPVLALNYADTHATKVPNLYQFGLAPEDEAAQVANDIWLQGARSAMVISPDSQWGDRVADAFIEQWQLLGGNITSKARFTQPDKYLNSIKNALSINESEQRHATLQYRMGKNLEFESRRRQDIDTIFMVAFPAQARQLNPILIYQRAESIPVVATSNLYSGQPAPDKDKDLNNIRFVEMPWRLYNGEEKQAAKANFPSSMASYATLVALGIDAYRLYPRLPQMALYDDVRVQGVTGKLSMNNRGRVERQLDWAVITDGEVVPVIVNEPVSDDELSVEKELIVDEEPAINSQPGIL